MAGLVDAGGALVAGRAPRSGRRVLVSLALGLVALAVVGMHQLSLGHVLVTAAGPTGGHAHGTSHQATTTAHAGHHPTSPGSPTTVPGADHGWAPTPGGGTAPAGEEGCPGCGDHALGPGTCLLALTLLVLFWWLRLPRHRPSPPARRPARAAILPRRPPRAHALSLLELSVLRT